MSCYYRNIYFESDQFYKTTLHTLSLIQIPLHTFATCIILWKTPRVMEKVKYPMLLIHLTCASWDILINILLVPVVIFPICAGYPLGLLQDFGVPIWLQTYFGLTFLFGLGPAVVMFFENRYNYLVRQDSESRSRKIKRGVHYFINYFLTVATFIPAVHNGGEPRDSRSIALAKLPCLPRPIADNPIIYSLGNEVLIQTCVPTFLAIFWAQILFFFVKTSFFIFRNKGQSRRTSDLQKKFFLAICVQVALPFVLIMIPACYVISQIFTKHFDILLSNLSIIWATNHGMFSTMIMLMIHKPYRTETLRILRLDKPGRDKIYMVFLRNVSCTNA